MNEWENVRYDDLGDQFWMTKEVNNAAAFEDSLIKSIGGWFSSFSGVNIDTGTFSFNMESFVNQFSQIFVIFASSLLVILFGVNIIRTAIEYQLFTLKGAVTLFGRLFLAEVWIQLSTKICIMIVKIFNELMASIIAALNVSGLLKTSSITFTAHRSGIYMVGEIVFFAKSVSLPADYASYRSDHCRFCCRLHQTDYPFIGIGNAVCRFSRILCLFCRRSNDALFQKVSLCVFIRQCRNYIHGIGIYGFPVVLQRNNPYTDTIGRFV